MINFKLELVQSSDWRSKAIEILEHKIREIIKEKSFCNVMLTGGNTAKSLYERWSLTINSLGAINFYWGDERFLPKSDLGNNYNLALKSLFKDRKNANFRVFPINTELESFFVSAEDYGRILPEKMDILLLSLGEDGHIASLFPYSQSIKISDKKVITADGPAPYRERITITKSVIKTAENVIVLAIGKSKGRALRLALKDDATPMSSPLLLVENGIVILDVDAFESMKLD